jgi:hypothetical protein
MRRRYRYRGYDGRRHLRVSGRYDYGLRRRMGPLPGGGVVVVLLALAALLVLASLILDPGCSGSPLARTAAAGSRWPGTTWVRCRNTYEHTGELKAAR